MRAAFDAENQGYLLSAAVSPSKRVVDAGYDVQVLSDNLDWIAVMCYDYHGQWDKITGHVAPMYAHDEDIDVTFNTVSIFVCRLCNIYTLSVPKVKRNIQIFLLSSLVFSRCPTNIGGNLPLPKC